MDLKQTRTAMATSGAKKKYFFYSLYFIKHIFTLVTLYVSVFAKITLTPDSLSERNNGC